ncbi:hypothetical protein CK203_115619 [Vitis vinifera]|uniref:Uncharacterized protein n=1 Tax=Vitis vinifera TaxID=29760 RepID=A0A438C869_VITVI|nr:hypothetical protein CK203_115619 [Vitis vinifera]
MWVKVVRNNMITRVKWRVKLQKHNTEAHGMKYKNGLHCTARIVKSEGVCFLNFLL